jgi:hypothetical protein
MPFYPKESLRRRAEDICNDPPKDVNRGLQMQQDCIEKYWKDVFAFAEEKLNESERKKAA